jgi:hypothetical protein
MSLGLFDFHDRLPPNAKILNEEFDERDVRLCLNRFKTCQIDPGSHKYTLNTEIENGIKILNI